VPTRSVNWCRHAAVRDDRVPRHDGGFAFAISRITASKSLSEEGDGMTSRGIEVLNEAESRMLLPQRSLGRIGVKIGDDIVVLPVYYAVHDGDIVFRTDPGTKLNAAVLGTQVAFEIDSGGSPPWSVLVIGHAEEVRDLVQAQAARTQLGHDWPAGDRENVVRIRTERVTGRRLHGTA
jgi:nitroimidazol reductase NimA-like FMN-containing flavoprotein (pyridoxamine 5'-phosphate oxidase superfamily)